MRKNAFILMACLFLVSIGAGGRTLRHVLVQMPREVLPLLSAENVLDAVDFHDSRMRAAVKNRMGETSVLTTLTDTYAAWDLSAASRAELKLLSAGKDTLVCLVHTYLTPEPMSVVQFYSLSWQPLAAKRFVKLPAASAFLRPGLSDTDRRTALAAAEGALTEARLSADGATLRFVLHADGGDPDRRKELGEWFCEQLTYVWRDRRFERQ